MTEAEWLTSDNFRTLLENALRRVSGRKLRLALCGCLRAAKVWPLLKAQASRRAVEVGEAFADGIANLQELGRARHLANVAAGREWRKRRSNPPAAYLANYVCLQDNNM